LSSDCFFARRLSVSSDGEATPGAGYDDEPLCHARLFLLLASRAPSAHRSLIAFTAWSSFAHAGIMSLQALLNMIERRELIGSAVFILIGVALIALAPAKQPVEKATVVTA